MGRFVDRVGQVFGRLRVLSRAGTDQNKKVVWCCACKCGKEVLVTSGSLVTGNTTSCGCLFKERVTKHGGWRNSSYNTWRAMIRRCTVTTDKDYPRWGGTGITVCPEWMDYTKFLADMGEPEGNETIDRIDPYGNYEPSNCRWASLTTQARNIRVPKKSDSGVLGVIKTSNNKWIARITSGKKCYYGLARDTVEKAAVDRKELERIHWGAA